MGLGGHAGPWLPFPAPPDLLVGCNEAPASMNAPLSVLQTDQRVQVFLTGWATLISLALLIQTMLRKALLQEPFSSFLSQEGG